jgi:hypothetical protein
MAKRLTDAGFPASDIQVIGETPRYQCLVARIRGRNPALKPILMLAHLDVVDARREDWSTDPYTLVEKDGWFYGRGTMDDKQGAAILVATLLRMKQDDGFVPDRDLIVALTAEGLTPSIRSRLTPRAGRRLQPRSPQLSQLFRDMRGVCAHSDVGIVLGDPVDRGPCAIAIDGRKGMPIIGAARVCAGTVIAIGVSREQADEEHAPLARLPCVLREDGNAVDESRVEQRPRGHPSQHVGRGIRLASAKKRRDRRDTNVGTVEQLRAYELAVVETQRIQPSDGVGVGARHPLRR